MNRAGMRGCPAVGTGEAIGNAGVLRNSSMLAEGAEAAARVEMEINFFGVLAMVRAFAPILAGNRGGAIVDVLSVASWISNLTIEGELA